ncbi:MAG: hypothetical protein PHF37_03790 [Phycisphaerae bacterium]|nr:hypothetical protein [Phycisphaerae bacterium]
MRNDENINELAGKFFDGQAREKFIDNHEKIERMWAAGDADITPQAIERVKAAVNRELTRRRYAARVRRFAVAAAVVMIAGAGLLLMVTRPSAVEPAPVTVANIWESESIAEDENIAAFADEIAAIENELAAVRLGEQNEFDEYSYVTKLELELIEEENIFWKG